MTLDEKQKQQVAKWIEDGSKLSEVQTRLASEFGIKLTYMEVRFLVDDLQLTPHDPVPSRNDEPAPLSADKGAGPAEPAAAEPARKGVSVTVDTLTKPGALVSGNVTFSDGKTADWYLDQAGRLGLAPKTEGYRPSASDLQEFQVALEREITRAGF